MTTKANTHASHEYHLRAMAKMKEFIDRYENPSQAVDVMMQSQLQQTMARNQLVIESKLFSSAVSKAWRSVVIEMIESTGLRKLPSMKVILYSWCVLELRRIPL